MINNVMHIGITISNMEKSVAFYRDILGFTFQGEIVMEGKEAEILFNKKGVKAKVGYLNGSDLVNAPPVELIQFVNAECKKDECNLFKTSISEICFSTDNIEKVYYHLLKNNVECLSSPQLFDYSALGFSKSKAFYFKDPDGIILEIMQTL